MIFPKRVKLCGGRWDVALNSLWLWWYCGCVVAMETYLLYRAVVQCKAYNQLPWASSPYKPVLELYVYIALIVLSIMCVPFFLLTSLFHVGNYANDGVRLGRDSNVHKEHFYKEDTDTSTTSTTTSSSSSASTGDNKKPPGKFRMLWRSLGPLCHSFHIVSAFALLLPTALLQAQQIKYGFITPDEIWSSELDTLFGKNVLSSEAFEFRNLPNTSTPIPSSLPDLIQTSHDLTSVTPEMINYVFALVVFGIRYSAVFWYTNTAFSFLFSFMQLFAILQSVFQYSGYSIVYKFTVNIDAVPGLDLFLPPAAVIGLFLISNTLIYFSAISVFNYGFAQYSLSFWKYLYKRHPVLAHKAGKCTTVGCQGYWPHTVATLCLILIVSCRGPVVYDYVILYRNTGFSVILACIVMDVIYMIGWIAMWFGFTLKQTWLFKVKLVLDDFEPVYTIHRERSRETVGNHLHSNGVATRPAVDLSETRESLEEVIAQQQQQKKQKQQQQKQLQQQQQQHQQPQPQAPTQPQPPRFDTPPEDQLDSADHYPSSPHSPTGVLRKSGERRHRQQRVKFDEDEIEAKGKVKKRSRRPKQREVKDDEMEKPNKIVDDYEDEQYRTNTTPENTLTRSYRHSLRDKCGQYYTAQSIPPAAHSSPMMRNRPLSDSFSKADLLEPLRINTQPPERQYSDHSMQNERQNRKPPMYRARDTQKEGPYADLPPLGSSDCPPRLRSSYAPPPKSRENRHSYPPPLSPKPQIVPTNKPPREHNEEMAVDVPNDIAHELNNPVRLQYIHKPSHSIDSAHGSSHSGSTSRTDMSFMNGGIPRGNHTNLQNTKSSAPDKVRNLNRELKIVLKPELNRRDSALPSSNETSSNDSEDNVLCSQV